MIFIKNIDFIAFGWIFIFFIFNRKKVLVEVITQIIFLCKWEPSFYNRWGFTNVNQRQNNLRTKKIKEIKTSHRVRFYVLTMRACVDYLHGNKTGRVFQQDIWYIGYCRQKWKQKRYKGGGISYNILFCFYTNLILLESHKII